MFKAGAERGGKIVGIPLIPRLELVINYVQE